MKKSLLALAALATATSAVQAQSTVTVYGLVDAAVEYVSNANAAKSNLLRLNSGGMNTSRLGFRGTEDLGGGLNAVFQLETGLTIDTGGFDGAAFGRQANVGLEGNFGRVIAGRSYSTAYDFMLPFDPMGYAPMYSWATSGNATGGRKDGMLTGVSNLVKYQGTFGGFKLGATYGFGEAVGSTTDSAKYAVGAGYAGGPFSAAAIYDQVNGTIAASGSYDKTTILHLGAGYQVSDSVKLNAGYRHYKKSLASGAADLRSDLFWGGVNYQAAPALTLTGAVYYQDIKNVASGADADPMMYVLRAKQALSKRTDLYVTGSYAKAKNNQLVSVSRDDAGFDNKQTAVSVGIQHRF